MRYFVQVKTNSRKDSVEKKDDTHLKVFVNAPATEGKANRKLLKILASYFDIAPSVIHIVSGLKSKNKIIKIEMIRGQDKKSILP